MATDPRRAFQALIQAWEEFHAAVIDTEDSETPRVLRASERLADAYTVYDDVIFTNFGVEAPFDTYDDEDFDDDDIDFDDFDEDFDEDFDSDFDDFSDDEIDDINDESADFDDVDDDEMDDGGE